MVVGKCDPIYSNYVIVYLIVGRKLVQELGIETVRSKGIFKALVYICKFNVETRSSVSVNYSLYDCVL